VSGLADWPMYGLNEARTRYLDAPSVKPPFSIRWRFKGNHLLEYSPVLVGNQLFAINNNGLAFAMKASTGKARWKRQVASLNASSPAYAKHRLYIVNLVPGHIVKLDAKTGKTIWKRSLPSRAESSPLVIDRTVYFGCEDGNLYALSTRNGNVRWSTPLGGAVKSAPAYYGGYSAPGPYYGCWRWRNGYRYRVC
jgi:outer membrane protein assembly factor BamB